MKKSILSALGLLFVTSVMFAQQTSIGLRAGYTFSDVLMQVPDNVIEGNPDFDISDNYQPLHSFHIGIDGLLKFSERWGVNAGVIYARKGYTGTLAWPSGGADAAWELHYLTLPMVVDFRLWKGLSLQGGAEAGWLMDARVKSAGNSFDPQNLFSINDFDFGLVGGLEYRFAKGFFIGARYIAGIAPLYTIEFTNDVGELSEEIAVRNSAAQISLGYRHIVGE